MTKTIKKENAIRAYWLGHKLKYGDGREARKGRTHSVDCEGAIKLCAWGLHASRRASEAMCYASGSRKLWRVLIWGKVEEEPGDKLVGSKRMYLEWVRVPGDVVVTFCQYKDFKFNAEVNKLFRKKGHRWPKKGEIK